MPLNDSYLFDAGWLFFALWTLIVGAVSIAAFRRDLFHPGQISNSRIKISLRTRHLRRKSPELKMCRDSRHRLSAGRSPAAFLNAILAA